MMENRHIRQFMASLRCIMWEMPRVLLHIACSAALAAPVWAEPTAQAIAQCREVPTATCLADIGYAFALRSAALDEYVGVVDYLGQMGRVEQAETLAQRIAGLEGHTGAQAERMVGLRVAPYRMIEAFKSGVDLETIEAGPQGFLAKSALMRMAGIVRSGSFLKLERPVDPQVRSVLRSILAKTDGTRFDRIVAADILLTAGEEAAALALLEDLPVDSSPRTNLSQPMIRLLGPDRVWEIYQGMDRISVWWIADLAKLSQDPEQARFFLQEMYDRASRAETPRDRAFDLSWVIETAKELGDVDLAGQAMALQVAEIDPTGPEMRVLVRSHLFFGSSAEDIRFVLRQAEKRLKTQEDATARSNIVNTVAGAYAEIGDARRAVQLLERGGADARIWSATALREIRAETRAYLLSRAERHLSGNDWNTMLASMAAALARPERSEAERGWARATAWALLDVDPPEATYEAGYFYDRILNAALVLNLPDLRDAVLRRSAETALSEREAVPILQAAYQYYRLRSEAAR